MPNPLIALEKRKKKTTDGLCYYRGTMRVFLVHWIYKVIFLVKSSYYNEEPSLKKKKKIITTFDRVFCSQSGSLTKTWVLAIWWPLEKFAIIYYLKEDL